MQAARAELLTKNIVTFIVHLHIDYCCVERALGNCLYLGGEYNHILRSTPGKLKELYLIVLLLYLFTQFKLCSVSICSSIQFSIGMRV